MTEPDVARPAAQPRFAVAVDWDVRIVARDGVELSANVWRPVPPVDAPGSRFPAILEMIPYGKDSWRRNADIERGRWFAERGFALCRLDVRGTGSSGGIALDEYTEDETRDGCDAVAWLAAQAWCNGRVGMWGISYGGFTAIQVARERPRDLAAIVPFYATDDRYLDDVHYRGGCLTASELSQYAVSQVAMNAMPPDPTFRGAGWRDEWLARLEATPIWLFEWLRQLTDGPYWRRGSLAPDHEALEVPTLMVGGWCDEYVDPVLRMQERCIRAPRRSIVGNWVHEWPHDAYPGPDIDELHEVARFFGHWLADEPNRVMDEPGFTWFEREWAPPQPFPTAWPGRWRAAPGYPHPAVEERRWILAGGAEPGRGILGDPMPLEPPRDGGVDALPHLATVGTTASLSWGAGGEPNGLARDGRPDEARSLVYTSKPLAEPISILGFPAANLTVSATMPVATLVCRLVDVAPDGLPHEVAAGVLNLTHRSSHADPQPLEPGQAYDIVVPLRASGYRFGAGHRIRLVVSTSAWPVIWPSPYPGEVHVHRGAAARSSLVLPVVPAAGGPGDLPPPAFKTTPPDIVAVGGGTDEPARWVVSEDVLAGTVTVESAEAGTTELPDGRSLATSERLTMTASDADPARAALDSAVEYRWREREFETEIRSTARLRSDAESFELEVDLVVDLDGERFFERRQAERVPRRLV
jgi:putative CocE/NonD family hydrolase